MWYKFNNLVFTLFSDSVMRENASVSREPLAVNHVVNVVDKT